MKSARKNEDVLKAVSGVKILSSGFYWTNAFIHVSPHRIGLFSQPQAGIALSNLRIAYGSMPVVFRFGTNPTGIRVTSFRELISITETSFVTAIAT